MKRKKGSLRKFIPMPATAAVFAMAASGAHAQIPVFEANFPASWNGTSTTVSDQSSAGNLGYQSGTATYTTATVPSGAASGTGSMALSSVGGIKVTGNGTTFPTDAILNNTTVAADGGFIYNIDFLWNGGFSTSYSGAQKLIDYAGTESLQLVANNATSATLEMLFANDTGVESTAVSTTIVPNTWYNVSMEFNTTGNSLVAGDISGTVSMTVNGGTPITGTATKGTYGDSLNRPIGIGEYGYGVATSIIGLDGDIYNASVDLVPEPSSLAMSALGGVGVLGMMLKSRRRKA